MKYLSIILLVILSIEVQSRSDEPTTQAQIEKDIAKRIKKTHLHYLRLTDGCQHTKSLYVALKPSGGPFSGHDIEMVIVDGKIFRRFRQCDNCPFSPWRHIDNHPYTDKVHKQHGFLVCPDGSIQFPSETDK